MDFASADRTRRPQQWLGVSLGLILVATGSAWWAAQEALGSFRAMDASHRVLYELEATLAHAVSIQSGARGFSLTGDEGYLAPYEKGLLGIQHAAARLRMLCADDRSQASRLQRLSSLVGEEVGLMQQRLATRRSGGLQAASTAAADGRGKQVVEAIRGVVATMQNEERRRLDERTAALRRAAVTSLAVLLAALAGAAASISVVWRGLRAIPSPANSTS